MFQKIDDNKITTLYYDWIISDEMSSNIVPNNIPYF